jgi:hypothetical protein
MRHALTAIEAAILLRSPSQPDDCGQTWKSASNGPGVMVANVMAHRCLK